MLEAAERVVLVDAEDRAIGTAPKLAVHRSGQLHRAFSIFLLDDAGRLLLQRRSASKYHSAGLWSNSCCGHPRPGEGTRDAARRRLREEMGIDCELVAVGRLVYRMDLANGLFEHEYDHLFLGRYDGPPAVDPDEVMDWQTVAVSHLLDDLRCRPHCYTPWLPALLLEGDSSPAGPAWLAPRPMRLE